MTRLSVKYFNTLKDKSAPVDALEEWLSSAPVVTSSDAVTWWSAMLGTGHPLANMALDFLSIPGMLLPYHSIIYYLLWSQLSNFNRFRASILTRQPNCVKNVPLSLRLVNMGRNSAWFLGSVIPRPYSSQRYSKYV
jgi:hypothetical protein